MKTLELEEGDAYLSLNIQYFETHWGRSRILENQARNKDILEKVTKSIKK